MQLKAATGLICLKRIALFFKKLYNCSMNAKVTDTFNLITKLINSKSASGTSFYKDVLESISGVIDAKYYGIYFIDSESFECKGSISRDDKYNVLDEKFFELIHTQGTNSKVYDTNCCVLCTKLLIRNSLFGFVAAVRDGQFSEDEVCAFEALVSVVAYLIKDYELNDVFKMQLKAMQNAIEEKNSAYETIEKQHKKLLELDKTKTAFLANISHELRTPLNAIIGFSQALCYKIFGDLNEKQEEYVKDIHISGLHLLGMINEILDLSKIESKAMKISLGELSPDVVIQEAINILSPLSEQKNIEVNFENNCKKNIMADYQKLQQILFNLLSNAVKFTPDGGKIFIKIYEDGKDFILEVKDTGVGIDKKYHNKIFTKFVHLNNLYVKGQSSTGLGLTITKELVKLHKGKITLESTVNKGSTFRVQLRGAVV